jgi:molybdenum cofactor synthesis domain-containing protein
MNDQELKIKVAILAVGTELTCGEVVNSNASTIAANLTELGFFCDHHVCLPDDHQLIAQSLHDLVTTHEMIIVTGGLGPTSDDITRNVVADVAGQKLRWNESDWQRIMQRLQSVGAPLAESNKQQAYFPEKATIYPSHHGTASAFSLEVKNSKVFVLPGPPREIAGLWEDHLQSAFSAFAPKDKDQSPEIWHCLGQSESKLGELVEESLSGSGLLTGYRSHMPYIHIKVWIPQKKRSDFEMKWRAKLEGTLAPWLVGRNEFDAALELIHALHHCPNLKIIDRATAGYAASRIFSVLGDKPGLSVVTTNDDNLDASERFAVLWANFESGQWNLTLQTPRGHQSHSEQSRYKGHANADRLRAYVAEKSFIKLAEWLREA